MKVDGATMRAVILFDKLPTEYPNLFYSDPPALQPSSKIWKHIFRVEAPFKRFQYVREKLMVESVYDMLAQLQDVGNKRLKIKVGEKGQQWMMKWKAKKKKKVA